jgi:hypothetical protein
VAFVQQDQLSQDTGFRTRVEVAMCHSALAIQAEAPATANHTNRANYAKLVLNNPPQYSPLFAEAVCANDPLAFVIGNLGTLTDAQVQSACDAVFNALAGTT